MNMDAGLTLFIFTDVQVKISPAGGPFSVKWRGVPFSSCTPLNVLKFWPRWLPPGILSTAPGTLLWILYDPGKNYVENIWENSNIGKISTPNCDQFMCIWSLLPKAPKLVSSVHNWWVTITGDGQGDLFTHNKSLISWSIKCSYCIFKLLKHYYYFETLTLDGCVKTRYYIAMENNESMRYYLEHWK